MLNVYNNVYLRMILYQAVLTDVHAVFVAEKIGDLALGTLAKPHLSKQK